MCPLSQLWERGHWIDWLACALPNLPEAHPDWHLAFFLNQLTDIFLVFDDVRLAETTPGCIANLTVRQAILSDQGLGKKELYFWES